jgi:superfamily II DNA or RNA helicase
MPTATATRRDFGAAPARSWKAATKSPQLTNRLQYQCRCAGVSVDNMSDIQSSEFGLPEKVAALDSCALDMLGVLALSNSWHSESSWLELASASGVRGTAGQNLQKSQVRWFIERYVQWGLVTVGSTTNGRHYRVPREAALTVLQRLHDSKRLVDLHGRGSPGWGAHWPRREKLETDLRIGALERNPDAIGRVATAAQRHLPHTDFGMWFVLSLGTNTPLTVLECLTPEDRALYLRTLVTFARTNIEPVAAHLIGAALDLDDTMLRLDIGRLLILRGESERALGLVGLPKHGTEGLELLAAFWAGDYATAARLGAEAVASMKTREPKALGELEGLCHVLAGLASSAGDRKRLEMLAPIIDVGITGMLGESMQVAAAIHEGLMGKRIGLRAGASRRMEDGGWTSTWVRALHDVWLDVRLAAGSEVSAVAHLDAIEVLHAWAQLAHNHGFVPVAREFDALARVYAAETPESGVPTLATAFRPPEPWETVLAGLDRIVERVQSVPDEAPGRQKPREVIWELQITPHGIDVVPRIRAVRGKTGSRGKAVPLDTLLEADDVRMTAADRRLAGALDPDRTRSPDLRTIDGSSVHSAEAVFMALVGHPRVVDETGHAMQVECGTPKLSTSRVGGRLRVEIEPVTLVDSPLCWSRTDNKLVFYLRTPTLEQAVGILGRGIDMPNDAEDRLARTLARLSVAACVPVEGDLRPEAEQVDADPRLVLLLGWDGEQLTVDARVAPLGLDARMFPPGVGNAAISAELPAELRERGKPRLVHCERNLIEERRRLLQLERDTPTLAAHSMGPYSWCVSSLVDALEVLLELGHLGETIVLAWPEGKPLRPPIERDLNDLALAVASGTDWLELDVRLPIDAGLVLGFRELISQRESPRFVALGEGLFLALSEQLRRRIDALHNLGTLDGHRVRTSAVMLPVVEGLSDSLADASFDAKALARLERARELADARPRRPSGFEAKLRDYQREGYQWMWRLAEAELGACLADDMGLGKTVQALALLSARAAKGPALVVCPTSVIHNWIAETERFAPGLRPKILANTSNRAESLAACRPQDLTVCSYGLLVSEVEALAGIEFATVVFDEAHALKNEHTKRAEAARAISAGFRLGLTGTPVENRVTELWSLFRVLVPGLLGTRAWFNERFAQPITRGDREAAAQLRALLRHFILRRTKTQVAEELPARTEVTLEIEPTAAARAYYEAQRRRVLESVEGGDPRTKRFRILAAITRLRQAAVDPRLLDEYRAPAGAKIDALVEHVLALREEGHRALVFTQFLTSMALLRAAFVAAGIEFLELDGATPAAERARRVDAFQAGEGDVFVLSLRAGGVGMNLTGADYVLHLDPWWNPAVEDQATDRAHRIGQSRPVTVYRLISKGTIEEKILALHAAKRNLADDLLAGLEGAGALDLDELVGLLSD